MTLLGAVEMVRMGYGRPSAPSLHPLDATLNLPPERSSHRVRQRVAVEAAKNAFDDVVATLTSTTGAHVPKRQAEQLVVRAAQDFEVCYATQRCAHERLAHCQASHRRAAAIQHAQALVEAQAAAVQRWPQVRSPSRSPLERLSLLLHPWRVAEAALSASPAAWLVVYQWSDLWPDRCRGCRVAR